MLIKKLRLENFGVYLGQHDFDLSPGPDPKQNMIGIRGQNGVGKTTILEALQLSVMGALSLDYRVSQSHLETYLESRIHQSRTKPSEVINQAKVELELQYLFAGDPSTFRIQRSWEKVLNGFSHSLSLLENDTEITEISEKEKELYIRQLISPGIANLIFFDGEQLQRLNLDGELNKFLAESCRVVFGLHLVEMLEKDLHFYSKKLKTDQKSAFAIQDIQQAQSKIDSIKGAILEKEKDLQHLLEDKVERETNILSQEKLLAEQGRWEEDAIKEQREKEKSVKIEVEFLSNSLRELAGELLPFAAAPKMLGKLKARLLSEAEKERYTKAGEVLTEQFEKLSELLRSNKIWEKIGVEISTKSQQKLIDAIDKRLKWAHHEQVELEEDFIHIITEKERQILLSHISNASTSAPKNFAKQVVKILQLKSELTSLRAQLAKVPQKDILEPLILELKSQSKQLGKVEKAIRDTEEELSKLAFQLTLAERELQNIQTSIKEDESLDKRLILTSQTQLLLNEYHKRLLEGNLKKLGAILVEKFNLLCRKENYFDAAIIDSKTFNLSLFRQGQEVDHDYFSAGERQLLALSSLWALREMTRIQLPLVIDTPLGRLDQEHRRSMIEIFFPKVSHQVIVLGTESELDDGLMKTLSPFLTKVFELEYNSTSGNSTVQESQKWTLKTAV
ncbi:MAG: DNA sulfur modification protein DndD [Bacteroidota bacterium]